jgi:hypothetical protein
MAGARRAEGQRRAEISARSLARCGLSVRIGAVTQARADVFETLDYLESRLAYGRTEAHARTHVPHDNASRLQRSTLPWKQILRASIPARAHSRDHPALSSSTRALLMRAYRKARCLGFGVLQRWAAVYRREQGVATMQRTVYNGRCNNATYGIQRALQQ